MFWRRRKPFLVSPLHLRSDQTNYLASYDVANFHEMVIHNIGKMVGRPTICFQDDLVIVKYIFAIVLRHRKVNVTS